MSKKLITACMALVAFAAFVLPASAMAANEPQLTSEGVPVPVGASITGTAVNTIFTTTAGATQITCSHAHLTGTVTKNSENTVKGEIPEGSAIFKGTGANSADNNLPECTGSFGSAFITVPTKLCIESGPLQEEDEVITTGCTGKVKFIIGSTTAGECEYESTGAVQADSTTGGTEASVTTRDTSAGSGSKLIRGGFLCPTSGALKMTFGLKTTNGNPITVS
ncbi:MAG TPA: hypothetical protein VFN85_09410 [Solirubrobacterales bacterium]|nr:hypothetical protein [Solirubrobacterales bacterium]